MFSTLRRQRAPSESTKVSAPIYTGILCEPT